MLSTFVALFLSYVFYRSQVPIYVVESKILLRDPSHSTGNEKILDALGGAQTPKIIDNELAVLTSSRLLEQVVKSLDLYASVYNEGKVREEELYGSGSPIWFHAVQKDNISPSQKYYFKIDWKNEQVFINNKWVPFDSSVFLGNTLYQMEVNRFYSHNGAGKNFYVQFSSIEDAAASIAGALKMAALTTKSTVIDVKISTPIPQEGEDILLQLFQIYNDNSIDEENQAAAKTLAFIDSRLGIVDRQLDSVERSMEAYESVNSIYNLSSQAEGLFSRCKTIRY